MALTQRSSEDDGRVLAHPAGPPEMSRQDATIREAGERPGHERAVADASLRARAQYADVLDRLGT